MRRGLWENLGSRKRQIYNDDDDDDDVIFFGLHCEAGIAWGELLVWFNHPRF